MPVPREPCKPLKWGHMSVFLIGAYAGYRASLQRLHVLRAARTVEQYACKVPRSERVCASATYRELLQRLSLLRAAGSVEQYACKISALSSLGLGLLYQVLLQELRLL